MTDEIIIENKGDYIHARQYGADSYDASLRLWRGIVAACERHACYNILGETFTTVELSTMDAYDHVEIFKLVGVTLKHRVAWVHHVNETADGIRFAEMVLQNRGMVNGRLFATVDEAKAWLLGPRARNVEGSGSAAEQDDAPDEGRKEGSQ